ncbi:MAG: hypothetical protein JNK11_00485 [Alphaproteobacteria bacterium]|nr:hypothetical protein [Alphaproteobacteria bacterium]
MLLAFQNPRSLAIALAFVLPAGAASGIAGLAAVAGMIVSGSRPCCAPVVALSMPPVVVAPQQASAVPDDALQPDGEVRFLDPTRRPGRERDAKATGAPASSAPPSPAPGAPSAGRGYGGDLAALSERQAPRKGQQDYQSGIVEVQRDTLAKPTVIHRPPSPDQVANLRPGERAQGARSTLAGPDLAAAPYQIPRGALGDPGSPLMQRIRREGKDKVAREIVEGRLPSMDEVARQEAMLAPPQPERPTNAKRGRGSAPGAAAGPTQILVYREAGGKIREMYLADQGGRRVSMSSDCAWQIEYDRHIGKVSTWTASMCGAAAVRELGNGPSAEATGG